MIDVVSVHHTGFTVRDLDRSVDFYTRVLGFSTVMEQEKTGGYFAAIVGYADASVRMAHLRDPSGHMTLELFEYRHPITIEADLEPARLGNAHLCLVVNDLAASYQHLVDLGVECVSPPVAIDSGANAGGAGLYFSDPDGITFELFQPRLPS